MCLCWGWSRPGFRCKQKAHKTWGHSVGTLGSIRMLRTFKCQLTSSTQKDELMRYYADSDTTHLTMILSRLLSSRMWRRAVWWRFTTNLRPRNRDWLHPVDTTEYVSCFYLWRKQNQLPKHIFNRKRDDGICQTQASSSSQTFKLMIIFTVVRTSNLTTILWHKNHSSGTVQRDRGKFLTHMDTSQV